MFVGEWESMAPQHHILRFSNLRVGLFLPQKKLKDVETMPGKTFDVTKTTLGIMTWRYGKEHPCQCRFCKEKIKLGDRVVSMRKISMATAWFRKYIHEFCFKKSYCTFVPLLWDRGGSHG